MKKSYKSQSLFSEVKFFVLDAIKQNKLKIIISICCLFVALLTGIIIAIKYYDASTICLSNYGLADFSGGIISSSFFSRFFSMILIMLLLFACSFTVWTFPLGILILVYRTYLLGLNLTLMFILYGIPGMLVSLIIALPCQLAIVFVLLIYFVLMYSNQCACKQFGSYRGMQGKLKILLWVLLILFICNLFESLVLVIFNVNVILVI